MTLYEINTMACEATPASFVYPDLERFANLVAEATKEKAAQKCDGMTDGVNTFAGCAEAIRDMK